MNKYLILFFLVLISCTSYIEEESVSVPVTSPTQTPTPETEILSNNKNDGEMKYNHPKIVDNKEIKDPSVMDLLLAKEKEESKSFRKFLNLAELSEINFNDYEDITLLIPEDKGFESISNDIKEQIFFNKELAYEIVSNHILPFKFKESNLKKYSHLDTLNGGSLDIEVSDRKLIINQKIRIIEKDIKVEEGLVHLIDNPILNNINDEDNLNVPAVNFNQIIEKSLIATKMISSNEYNFNNEYTLELNFDNEGRYSGKYLCNNIFGNYQINDSGNIKMDFPASTKMFCFPPNEEVETNTDLMIEFISNNEMELKSNDGSTDEIYFESEGNKLFFQMVD